MEKWRIPEPKPMKVSTFFFLFSAFLLGGMLAMFAFICFVEKPLLDFLLGC